MRKCEGGCSSEQREWPWAAVIVCVCTPARAPREYGRPSLRGIYYDGVQCTACVRARRSEKPREKRGAREHSRGMACSQRARNRVLRKGKPYFISCPPSPVARRPAPAARAPRGAPARSLVPVHEGGT